MTESLLLKEKIQTIAIVPNKDIILAAIGMDRFPMKVMRKVKSEEESSLEFSEASTFKESQDNEDH